MRCQSLQRARQVPEKTNVGSISVLTPHANNAALTNTVQSRAASATATAAAAARANRRPSSAGGQRHGAHHALGGKLHLKQRQRSSHEFVQESRGATMLRDVTGGPLQ